MNSKQEIRKEYQRLKNNHQKLLLRQKAIEEKAKKNIFDPEEIKSLLKDCKRHNRKAQNLKHIIKMKLETTSKSHKSEK